MTQVKLGVQIDSNEKQNTDINEGIEKTMEPYVVSSNIHMVKKNFIKKQKWQCSRLFIDRFDQ